MCTYVGLELSFHSSILLDFWSRHIIHWIFHYFLFQIISIFLSQTSDSYTNLHVVSQNFFNKIIYLLFALQYVVIERSLVNTMCKVICVCFRDKNNWNIKPRPHNVKDSIKILYDHLAFLKNNFISFILFFFLIFVLSKYSEIGSKLCSFFFKTNDDQSRCGFFLL